ncbi:MAG: FmdE family protein [Desulfobulbaceae bacterium]|nr:FmdE family protein [Desulfobulbaceae bacterium]
MEPFEILFAESTKIHGHICPGQVIGVRLAMLGLREIGIDDPKGNDRKKVYVFVELDRCATDAIQSVTGCSMGKRSLRFVDNGVMAATFVNLETGVAVRVTALEESREASKNYCPEILEKRKRQLEAYKIMPEEELYKVERVRVTIPEYNMPGGPMSRVQCEACGDWVQNKREINQEGRILCRGCGEGRYYQLVDNVD